MTTLDLMILLQRLAIFSEAQGFHSLAQAARDQLEAEREN